MLFSFYNTIILQVLFKIYLKEKKKNFDIKKQLSTWYPI
jgi:hypothetical protein